MNESVPQAASDATRTGAPSLRTRIEQVFGGKAFARPLFYSYPGGLRFELSESGPAVEQFTQAMAKAHVICSDAFSAAQPLTVCLRTHSDVGGFGHRQQLGELAAAGVRITKAREIWVDPIGADEWFDESRPEWWLNVAFEAPASMLLPLLWCALVVDFGRICPNPRVLVYLLDLHRGVMAFPYDDRGMDIVGPNHEALRAIYTRHHAKLLPHDMAAMRATFGEARGTEGDVCATFGAAEPLPDADAPPTATHAATNTATHTAPSTASSTTPPTAQTTVPPTAPSLED